VRFAIVFIKSTTGISRVTPVFTIFWRHSLSHSHKLGSVHVASDSLLLISTNVTGITWPTLAEKNSLLKENRGDVNEALK